MELFLALTKSGGGGGKEGGSVKKEKKKADKAEKKKEEKPAEPAEELDETELALAAEPKSKDPFDALPKGWGDKWSNPVALAADPLTI